MPTPLPGNRKRRPKKPSPAQVQQKKAHAEQVATSHKTDSLDMGALKADLGTAWGVGLIMSNPELMALAYRSQGWTNARVNPNGKLFIGKKAEGVEWDAEKTALEIQNSNWYKQHDASSRIAENARLSDPATWERQLGFVLDSLTQQAVQMGAKLDPTQAKQYAEQILKANYSYLQNTPDEKIPDSIINQFLVPLIQYREDGSLGGTAGVSAADIRQLANDYGVPVTDQWVLSMTQKGMTGEITDQDIRSYLVGQAKGAYGGLAANISDTVSVKDLASSYIATLANTLEIDEDQIDLSTPEIKKALTFIDPSTGQARQKSLWEFEQELRNDPRWDKTKQGQQELSDAGMGMLRDFGFWK